MKCNNCGGFGILLKESLHLQRRYGNPSIKLYCPKCKGKLIFTIHEGGIKKYLEPALDLAKKYNKKYSKEYDKKITNYEMRHAKLHALISGIYQNAKKYEASNTITLKRDILEQNRSLVEDMYAALPIRYQTQQLKNLYSSMQDVLAQVSTCAPSAK